VKLEEKKKLVLVAEDDNSNFLLDLMILRKKYKVIHAWNGEEALNCVKKERPDLILMDIRMPVMNGYEAFEKIKAWDSSIPIIVITAYTLAEEEEYILDKGFDAYLPKPLNTDDFSKIIASKIK
jgi:CheY-like chemotaxis protein